MPLTFECGVCRSTYRLDQEQITPSGVKITCPKCLNFFILRLDSELSEIRDKPALEYIVPDGAYEFDIPPPAKDELTADRLITDRDLEESTETRTEIVSEKTLHEFDEPSPTQITHADLSDYPTEAPPQGKFEQYLIPASLLLLVFLSLMLLNYQGFVPIPGLETFRKSNQITEAIPTPIPTPASSSKAKYGFPQFEFNDSATATPTPTLNP